MVLCIPVLRIRDILVRIQIRGSVLLTNGSGSGQILLFLSVTFKMVGNKNHTDLTNPDPQHLMPTQIIGVPYVFQESCCNSNRSSNSNSMTTSSRSDELLQTTAEADTLPNSSNSNSSVDQGGGRMEAIRAELLTLAGKQYSLAKDIERSYLSLVLHTLSKSIMHYSLPRVE